MTPGGDFVSEPKELKTNLLRAMTAARIGMACFPGS